MATGAAGLVKQQLINLKSMKPLHSFELVLQAHMAVLTLG